MRGLDVGVGNRVAVPGALRRRFRGDPISGSSRVRAAPSGWTAPRKYAATPARYVACCVAQRRVDSPSRNTSSSVLPSSECRHGRGAHRRSRSRPRLRPRRPGPVRDTSEWGHANARLHLLDHGLGPRSGRPSDHDTDNDNLCPASRLSSPTPRPWPGRSVSARGHADRRGHRLHRACSRCGVGADPGGRVVRRAHIAAHPVRGVHPTPIRPDRSVKRLIASHPLAGLSPRAGARQAPGHVAKAAAGPGARPRRA